MDDHTRDHLLAKLSEAKTHEQRAREALHAHARDIDEVRKRLGNPYFYTARPAEDPESEAHFTGYKSAEPGLQLMHAWREAARELETIQRQVRDAGFAGD
jgi:hypothetical protein